MHSALDAVGRHRDQVERGRRPQGPVLSISGFVQEHDITLAVDAAIAVGHRVERGIVLVVTANGGQPKRVRVFRAEILAEPVEDEEVCLARRRRPDALSGGRSKVEAAGNADARVVALEDRKHILDRIADPIVIATKLSQSTTERSPSVARAMPATMAGSLRRCSDAGLFRPAEA